MNPSTVTAQSHKETFHSLVMIAGCCGTASVAIVALAFCLLRPISDSAIWAVAAMAFAPPLMGIGLAFFLTRNPERERAPSARRFASAS